MNCCFDPVLVYGILEEDRDRVLDAKLLEENGLSRYAQDVVRNFAGNFIYGVALSLEEVMKGVTYESVKTFASKYAFSRAAVLLGLDGRL